MSGASLRPARNVRMRRANVSAARAAGAPRVRRGGAVAPALTADASGTRVVRVLGMRGALRALGRRDPRADARRSRGRLGLDLRQRRQGEPLQASPDHPLDLPDRAL
ncbi:hypothetical protein KGQ64_05840, partial [bacterium]|nr:hypothetical protein [bacterium]